MKHLQCCKKLKTVVLKEGVKKLGELCVSLNCPETEKCDGS